MIILAPAKNTLISLPFLKTQISNYQFYTEQISTSIEYDIKALINVAILRVYLDTF